MRNSLAFTFVLVACTPAAEPPAPGAAAIIPKPTAEASATSEPPAPSADKTVQTLDDDAALQAGRVRFDGMVRPTKGGLDVRGVTIAHEKLRAALPPKPHGPLHENVMLGAKLRIVADLKSAPAEPSEGDIHIQSRSGDWFELKHLVSADIIAEPVMIEGTVGRSKGLFSISQHLVSRDDLAWALVGKEPVGARVRLWGQPRTVICPPQAQCLIGGSLPMFDVGRAELVK